MHRNGIQLHLSLLARRVERGDRPERRCAGVRAQNRDVAGGQFVAKLGAFGGVGQIDRAHLDGHAVLLGEAGGQRREDILAACGNDQTVAAGREFCCQRLPDALRGTGDHGAGVWAGSGDWHGAIVRWRS